MEAPFTNIHAHIFTARHAPDYFLKTAIPTSKLPSWLSTKIATKVDELIQRKGSRQVLQMLDWIFRIISPDYRDTAERYVEFIKMGISSTQKEIFDDLAQAHMKFPNYRIVVLTQVLDYLDLEQQSNHIKIQTQVDQVCELKRNALYQQHIYPFLGLDARMNGVDLLEDWVKKYISKDKGFCGIKIYPAAGYFPFDVRFNKVWEWAEKNNIPVMTHCTRGGSFYLGRFDSIVSSGGLDVASLNEDSPSMKNIRERITALFNDKSIQKNNHVWCNIFGHPENYRPVLEKYPNLKICLAHLGGSNEVIRKYDPLNKAIKSIIYPSYFQDNWYELVIDLMRDFKNVYSDISYTLSDEQAMKYVVNDFTNDGIADGKKLLNKLMYGTDFYMTLQETKGDEPGMQKLFFTYFKADAATLLTKNNPDIFLSNLVHDDPPKQAAVITDDMEGLA